MNGFEHARLLSALTFLVMALFLSGNIAPGARWRRWLRRATIVGFVLAIAAALTEIAIWLIG